MPETINTGSVELQIDRLVPHPDNSNVMPDVLVDKLAEQIRQTGRYPPVIVRPIDDRYQILDGHHRVLVLRRLDIETVQCVVWSVDDEQGLLLLATLNRLSGDDDPLKRAALLSRLNEKMDIRQLAGRLPEDAERVRKLLALHAAPPSPIPPRPVEQMPVCTTFFFLPEQKRAVEAVLRRRGGTREQALLELLGVDTERNDA